MSDKQHQTDQENGVPHAPAASTDGGTCLNRHIGDPPKQGDGNSCSHRWQAYKKMEENKGLYNGDRYKSLVGGAGTLKTAQRVSKSSGEMHPWWYKSELDKPTAGSWDIGEETLIRGAGMKNFWVKCYAPYWHEAHHVVPNSTLRGAITAVDGGAYAYVIRNGLAGEKYNLNHKDNMIMLPLDIPVAEGMRLPRHRQTASSFAHAAYSKKIGNLLNKVFGNIAEKLDEHKKVNYKNVKKKITDISETMYTQVSTSQSASLDDMTEGEFKAE